MVAYVDETTARVLYAELAERAPRWLADGGWKTATEFVWWCRQEVVFLVRYPEAVVLVTNWYRGLRAEAHPLIFDWRVRDKLAERLRDLADELNVGRLEFRFKWPSRTLKRYLAGIGGAFEGVARNADWTHLDGGPRLIDVEIWSILRGDLGGERDGR